MNKSHTITKMTNAAFPTNINQQTKYMQQNRINKVFFWENSQPILNFYEQITSHSSSKELSIDIFQNLFSIIQFQQKPTQQSISIQFKRIFNNLFTNNSQIVNSFLCYIFFLEKVDIINTMTSTLIQIMQQNQNHLTDFVLCFKIFLQQYKFHKLKALVTICIDFQPFKPYATMIFLDDSLVNGKNLNLNNVFFELFDGEIGQYGCQIVSQECIMFQNMNSSHYQQLKQIAGYENDQYLHTKYIHEILLSEKARCLVYQIINYECVNINLVCSYMSKTFIYTAILTQLKQIQLSEDQCEDQQFQRLYNFDSKFEMFKQQQEFDNFQSFKIVNEEINYVLNQLLKELLSFQYLKVNIEEKQIISNINLISALSQEQILQLPTVKQLLEIDLQYSNQKDMRQFIKFCKSNNQILFLFKNLVLYNFTTRYSIQFLNNNVENDYQFLNNFQNVLMIMCRNCQLQDSLMQYQTYQILNIQIILLQYRFFLFKKNLQNNEDNQQYISLQQNIKLSEQESELINNNITAFQQYVIDETEIVLESFQFFLHFTQFDKFSRIVQFHGKVNNKSIQNLFSNVVFNETFFKHGIKSKTEQQVFLKQLFSRQFMCRITIQQYYKLQDNTQVNFEIQQSIDENQQSVVFAQTQQKGKKKKYQLDKTQLSNHYKYDAFVLQYQGQQLSFLQQNKKFSLNKIKYVYNYNIDLIDLEKNKNYQNYEKINQNIVQIIHYFKDNFDHDVKAMYMFIIQFLNSVTTMQNQNLQQNISNGIQLFQNFVCNFVYQLFQQLIELNQSGSNIIQYLFQHLQYLEELQKCTKQNPQITTSYYMILLQITRMQNIIYNEQISQMKLKSTSDLQQFDLNQQKVYIILIQIKDKILSNNKAKETSDTNLQNNILLSIYQIYLTNPTIIQVNSNILIEFRDYITLKISAQQQKKSKIFMNRIQQQIMYQFTFVNNINQILLDKNCNKEKLQFSKASNSDIKIDQTTQLLILQFQSQVIQQKYIVIILFYQQLQNVSYFKNRNNVSGLETQVFDKMLIFKQPLVNQELALVVQSDIDEFKNKYSLYFQICVNILLQLYYCKNNLKELQSGFNFKTEIYKNIINEKVIDIIKQLCQQYDDINDLNFNNQNSQIIFNVRKIFNNFELENYRFLSYLILELFIELFCDGKKNTLELDGYQNEIQIVMSQFQKQNAPINILPNQQSETLNYIPNTQSINNSQNQDVLTQNTNNQSTITDNILIDFELKAIQHYNYDLLILYEHSYNKGLFIIRQQFLNQIKFHQFKQVENDAKINHKNILNLYCQTVLNYQATHQLSNELLQFLIKNKLNYLIDVSKVNYENEIQIQNETNGVEKNMLYQYLQYPNYYGIISQFRQIFKIFKD